jgi:predicted ribosome quality control (RQC) complex YloA/Tae2 family protein
VRSDGIIEDAFKNGRQFIGLRYNAPAGNAFPSLIALRAAFTERGNANVIDALRSAVPPLGPILVKEAVYRAGIPPTCIVSTLIQHTTDTLFQELQGVLDELHAPQPRVYLSDDDSPYMLSLVALKHLGIAHEESFRDIHSAVQRMLARRRSASSFLTKREELRTRLQNLLAKTERTLAAVRHDLQNYDRSIQYQQYGTFLLVHASEVSKGRTSLEMPSGPGPVQIPLDPALTPVQNAQRFFEKAKHARRAQENAHVRVQLLGRRQSMIRELLHSLEATTSREELDQLMTTQKLPLDSLGIGSSQETREHIPFRTFVVDGGFEVWAGKDNANNDLLTLKYARPNDLWFHVRGVSGSHVVLRMATGKGPPGKKAKEQAAGIAAYYSKMRKAGMAPVTMTERKYIRKPKGAPAGTVMVSREETVFATPGLPSTAVLDTGNE